MFEFVQVVLNDGALAAEGGVQFVQFVGGMAVKGFAGLPVGLANGCNALAVIPAYAAPLADVACSVRLVGVDSGQVGVGVALASNPADVFPF